MSDNKPENIKGGIAGVPVLVTVIERDTTEHVFHIVNCSWLTNKTPMPKMDEVSKISFNLAGLYVKRGSICHISRQPESCIAVAVENAFDSLWNGEIDAVTIFNPPGITLFDFCEKLPPIGGSLQWESADLNRIVEAIRKAHADYFAEE